MRFFVFLFLSWSLFTEHAMATSEKMIYGYVEKVSFPGHDLTLSAKLDTGAKSASLNASHISEITIQGKPYLQFIVPSKEGNVTFQCEYVGRVNIKTRTEEAHTNPLLLHSAIKRPVVLMRLKLGAQEKMVRVNLTNRKRFIYPLLLGRETIVAFDGMVDPSLRYTLSVVKNNKEVHP